ncbi:CPBP family intramembrane metalloprotease [Bacillus sp. BRMEA1]|uniref:CPBP family intramembrane glutamic endopeptidase n=1 Tax=Neobacillus endophyticus TaxID=2738405 RepID=UPI0015650274|nr:CPBP family intramembrane glutamic endopeptidase [Neobacillus endophyticus]NRD77089.1 CPBP family intramembrane metalloprotease [Neobacillus endophyticus]
MTKNKTIVLKIIGLEFLLMFFYVANGATVSITKPSNPVLQFIGLVPLAFGIFIYLLTRNNWRYYFFDHKIAFTKNSVLLLFPLLIVLMVIITGNKGLNTSSISNLLLMFIMQFFTVGFIEETFFRGFMLRILLPKGVKKAVILSSFLFGITHLLQLIGGQSIEATILQIIYAFLVGLALSMLILNNQSIIIAIIFHSLNDFLNFMGHIQGPVTYDYIIVAILFFYSLFLWRRTIIKENLRQNIDLTV